ncbi:GPI-anchored surface protein, putative [Bodo saltans]|uniref:GPI-anchored surface protein, putative n=1 Tax=Bodo saltans TaxID=75058 RepID=A0A0S4IW15_BODSA|nr:GPI-anchored surface protein, putative [Bodo saltans]|eukprot:CUF24462.1 GPI-anchored surface protein, putative [Bodo saltans]
MWSTLFTSLLILLSEGRLEGSPPSLFPIIQSHVIPFQSQTPIGFATRMHAFRFFLARAIMSIAHKIVVFPVCADATHFFCMLKDHPHEVSICHPQFALLCVLVSAPSTSLNACR